MTTAEETIITHFEAGREVRSAIDGDLALAEELLIQGTDEIEAELGWNVISRGTITEYHTFRCLSSRLWLDQRPKIISVTSIHEDTTRAYGASALLTEGTDYVVDYERGLVTRLNGDAEVSWLTGFEAIKVVYAAGYTQEAAPGDLKRIARELFARQWRGIINQSENHASENDGIGSRTFLGPAELTSHMLMRLRRHKKYEFPGGTTFSRSSVA